jgi:molybdopterin converting factor small subunit
VPQVFIPSSLRRLSGGRAVVIVPGTTVRGVIEALDRECPGAAELIIDDERIRPGLQIAIDGTVAALGLLEPVPDGAEVHILPAIGGGAPSAAAHDPGDAHEEGLA